MIISSYRHYDCNLAAGGATYSRHKDAKALDWMFVGSGARSKYYEFKDDVVNRTGIFPELLDMGIRGFGAYNNAFHIDTRTGGMQRHEDIQFALWGKFVEGGYAVDYEHPYGIDD